MRPSRLETLVATAFTWAERSTCDRLHVGCVIEREGRILVQGYNGAPAGLPHCNHECDCGQVEQSKVVGVGYCTTECNSQRPCLNAVHAEQNAISFAARWGVELEGSSLVCTHQPCLSCAQSIINAGIVAVTYVYPYRLTDGHDLLVRAGIPVEVYLDWEEPSVIGSSSDDS